MKKKLWVVIKTRNTETERFTSLLGLYEEFSDAVNRVDEVFMETEESYEDTYLEMGDTITADNHHNGYAEVSLNGSLDETIIRATEYDMNAPLYESI